MAQFIEIKQGISLLSSEIEGVLDFAPKTPEQVEQGIVTMVYTHHNDYPSIIPRETLIELIEVLNGKEAEVKETREEASEKALLEMRNILGEMGSFAG